MVLSEKLHVCPLIAGLPTAAFALDITESLHVKPVAIGECH